MSKRFIDTKLFDDGWFMNLSKDGKLLWLYMITKCDHAGIIELNNKLVKFQTEIKSIQTVTKELSNRLITIKQNLFFIPKFIEFQYPNFPNSNVRQQQSAIAILEKYGLFLDGDLIVNKQLTNSYDNDNDNESDNVNDKKEKKKKDFLEIVLKIWCELYLEKRNYEFEVVNKEKERSAIGKLARIFKKNNPDAETEDAIEAFRKFFIACLNIDNQFIFNGISPSFILSQYNQIHTILKNDKQKKQPATSDQELEAIIDYFYKEKEN